MLIADTPHRLPLRAVPVLAGALVLALVLAGCDALTDDDLGDSNPQTPSIVDYVVEVDALSVLEQAATRAGLVEALGGDGLTLFAPTDAAFNAIDTSDLLADGNADLLEEVLTYHVVPEVVNIREGDGRIPRGESRTYQTLEGQDLTVSVAEDGRITVNGVLVSNNDANASNGVVHVVDGVLLETVDAVDRAELAPRFRILRRLVERAGLSNLLRGPGPDAGEGLTVFAPTNEAFLDALDGNDNGRIDDGEVPSTLSDILAYHVLDSVFFAGDVPTTATDVETLEGSTVAVQRSTADDGSVVVTVNGNPVAVPNVAVENGVIHGIGAVLLP